MIKDASAIILAGGESSRMGENKAFIKVKGRALIEVMIEKLSGIFEDIMVITNSPHMYEKYGMELHADIIKNCGPMGGILTGLMFSKHRYNLIVGCDMPFLDINFLKFMFDGRSNHDIIVPENNGRPEPLCAIYSKRCIAPIKREIAKSNLRIKGLLQSVKTKIIKADMISKLGVDKRCFTNINTPKEKKEILYGRIEN